MIVFVPGLHSPNCSSQVKQENPVQARYCLVPIHIESQSRPPSLATWRRAESCSTSALAGMLPRSFLN